MEAPSFKNINGVFLLNELFYERATNKSNVVYTLKDEDHLGYPSLFRLYMEADDPTEYAFATAHLGSWSHWLQLRECSWFKPLLERWREELHLRAKAIALAKIKKTAAGDTRDALNAQKYLIEKGYEKTPATPRGRPSKDQINGEAKLIAEDRQRVENDLARLMN